MGMSSFSKIFDWVWSLTLSIVMALLAAVFASEGMLLQFFFCALVSVALLPPISNKIFKKPDGILLRSISKIGIVVFAIATLAALNALFKNEPCDEYREARSACAASGDYSLCMKRMTPPSCPSEELNDATVGLEKAQRDFVDDMVRKY